MKIVLYSDDINLLTYWETSIGEDTLCIDDFKELEEIRDSLVIINYSAFEGSPQSVIQALKKENNSVLVLHRAPKIEVAKELLFFGADGYGNALMKAHFLLSAVDAINEGLIWLHPEFTSQLIYELPTSTEKDTSSMLEILSQREKEVANLLKNGDTYKSVAEKLTITPRTVKAHASSIYSKLNVKDRLALALLLK